MIKIQYQEGFSMQREPLSAARAVHVVRVVGVYGEVKTNSIIIITITIIITVVIIIIIIRTIIIPNILIIMLMTFV